jgi:hypothetical protein
VRPWRSESRIVSLLLVAAVWGHAWATIWNVTWDPMHDEDSIGAVVDVCVSGDTIRVGPGRYYEHIDLGTKSLRIEGTSGAAVTILDGSRPPPEGLGGILACFSGWSSALELDGLSLEKGQGVDRGMLQPEGGAIHFQGISFEARHCSFRQSSAVPGSGGALWLYVGSATIEDCVFEDNSASSGGTVFMGGGTFALRRCRIVTPDAAMFLMGVMNVDIDDSDFVGPGGPCVGMQAQDVRITGCRFEEARIAVLEMPIQEEPGTIMFTGNVVEFREADMHFQQVNLSQMGTVEVRDNTFVRAMCQAANAGGGPLTASGNIFYRSPTVLSSEGGGTLSCNDAWPDTITTYGDFANVSNIESDPLFCSPEDSDYRLSVLSPCAEGGAPPGCGQIGALEAACDDVPVVPLSWGRIKMLFRSPK